MKTLLKILLFVPKTTIKGSYKCLSYGNDEQLFFLMIAWAIFILNAKCSKKSGAEDFMVLIFFTNIMHYFSKLTIENLYLKGEFAKAIMSILYRQNKANKQTAKAVEKEVRKIGNQQRPQEKEQPRIRTIFVEQPQPKQELPKNEHNEPNEPTNVIELGKDEYKVEYENYENNENGGIEL